VLIQPPVDSHGRAFVEVTDAPRRIWSFPNTYAGVSDLGIRIESFEAFDASGAEISVHKIAPGQFEAATAASRVRYEVNLTPPVQLSDSARVSWLDPARGLLMLADLLATNQPESKAALGAKGNKAAEYTIVRVKLPNSWEAYSNENQAGGSTATPREDVSKEMTFAVADVDRAVFAVGSHLRSSQVSASGMTLRLVADGAWAFTDSDVLKVAGDVLKAHRDVLGAMPAKQGTLILIPFPVPQNVAGSRWSAETRGATVTLLMGVLPSKTAALLQLSVPLTHELFHLWVPNALALDGDYDWFYEGFTVYQAARSAVRLGQLTFQEFLNAIARAYDAYVAGVDHDRRSLIEASQRRWLGGESVVYQKSMLVALLYDLKLRTASHGKHSLDDVYRELFRQRQSAGAAAERRSDGNEAAMTALSAFAGVHDFPDTFIRRPAGIDLLSELAPFGLRVERIGFRTRISVEDQVSRAQRDLLRELGYNDRSRAPDRKKHS
jgi:predicted metalloprotease with PDZ domain